MEMRKVAPTKRKCWPPRQTILHSLSRSSQGPSNGPGKTRKHLKYYRLTSGDESQGKTVIKMVIKYVLK